MPGGRNETQSRSEAVGADCACLRWREQVGRSLFVGLFTGYRKQRLVNRDISQLSVSEPSFEMKFGLQRALAASSS